MTSNLKRTFCGKSARMIETEVSPQNRAMSVETVQTDSEAEFKSTGSLQIVMVMHSLCFMTSNLIYGTELN